MERESGEAILIIDEGRDSLGTLSTFLSVKGFETFVIPDVEAGREALEDERVDLVLLDSDFGGADGFDSLRDIRRISDVPVILISGRQDDVGCIVGLESGADDYVTKPFNTQELLARIGAVLRRTRKDHHRRELISTEGRSLWFSDWRVDPMRRRLYSPMGWEAKLTMGELNILTTLSRYPHRVLTRQQILRAMGESISEISLRTVDTRIRRLRDKIEPDPQHPTFIATERGAGYSFCQTAVWR